MMRGGQRCTMSPIARVMTPWASAQRRRQRPANLFGPAGFVSVDDGEVIEMCQQGFWTRPPGRHDPHRRPLRHRRIVQGLQISPWRPFPTGRSRRRFGPRTHRSDRHSREFGISLGILLRLRHDGHPRRGGRGDRFRERRRSSRSTASSALAAITRPTPAKWASRLIAKRLSTSPKVPAPVWPRARGSPFRPRPRTIITQPHRSIRWWEPWIEASALCREASADKGKGRRQREAPHSQRDVG